MRFTKSYEPGEFEPNIYALWEKTGAFQPKEPVYNSDENDTDNCYSLVMPPPNANGNLHIGHGLTIAIEDALARYYRLRGKSTWYIPGADHAGFETWVVYERNLEKQGHSRFEYSRDELYARVWDFVQEQRGNMELQVRALGASCAWPDLTFTLDENVIDRVYKTFEKMWNDGMIYRGEKLVNFCPKHQTAFADIEVEHEDEKGHLWEIAYRIVSVPDVAERIEANSVPFGSKVALSSSKDSDPRQPEESSSMTTQETDSASEASKVVDAKDALSSASAHRAMRTEHRQKSVAGGVGVADNDADGGVLTEIVVSTTRPETIFGDTAVAVNPEDPRYKDVIGGLVELPLTGRVIPIIADEHADMEYGTGAVKITPAHDFNDFEVGERHDLERIQVIGEDGRMLEAAGAEYAGLTTEECRKKVLQDLEKQGLLRGEKEIVHSVAHCYKCGTVIEPMLKAQWFVDVKRLADNAIKHLENNEIKFTPANKKKVLINYLANLKDWNISRQIPWGIPIPMFRKAEYRNGAGAPASSSVSSASSDALLTQRTSSTSRSVTPDSLNKLEDNRRVRGADKAEYAEDYPEWIFDTRTNLSKIEVGGVTYVRDEDTFDTWFSSSHWPLVCTDYLEGRENPYYPLNVMETAGDILFAWVARMIMMGLYVSGEVPFREVYLHGLVLDEHGQKMSKSKGNVINPLELVTKYGSDAFRLGILRGRSAGMNQAFSENSVVAGRNFCNKLWNLARFIQGMVDESQSGSVVAMEMAAAEFNAEIVNEGAVRAGAEMPYSTDNVGEDWICQKLTECKEEIEDDFANYRFAEAVEKLYSTIWDEYADWFIESQKIYKNVPLLKVTLEMVVKMLHPFAPFVTEAIWQSLSWTEGTLATQKWPSRLRFDPISARNFESLITIVSETRRVLTDLSEASKGKKWALLYGDDALVDDNQLLIAKLAGVSSVISCEGQPRGLRLAVANHEVYLDVPADLVKSYRDKLEERILAVGKELDALNARMLNPSYVDKAPAHLVKQTRDGIAEKTTLIERLKRELSVIE